jgi:SAM-dependent methyltransferase
MSEPFSYDEVPYPGHAFPQTHPDRLATMATLFGLQPAPPDGCRVLELGCGDGGNLNALAVALPGSRFTGIDFSGPAIAQAQAVAGEVGIQNVRFEQVGIESYDVEPGSFDYVIAHGVYSWVGAPLRDALLALCARALSEHGVAYVSYNALPGHRMRQTLRDMLAVALDGVDDPRERIAAARALLTEACAVWPPGEGLQMTVGSQARLLLQQDDALFFHDTLSPVNKALYFHEFVAHAAGHDLQFLAEAEYSEMQIEALPQDLQARLFMLDDTVRREQLLDFLKQRMFRQTLLCHARVERDRAPHPQRLQTLAAAGPIESVADPATGRVTLTGSAGSRLTTDHPVLIAALERIGSRWPAAAWIADLAGDDSGAELATICEALLPCFAANLVRLHTHPPALSTTPGEKPRASPLARLQARDRRLMTTLRHTSVGLEDELGWRLVMLLDGTRDRAALLAALAEGSTGPRADLERDLERSLNTLAGVGLLMAQ